MDVINLFFPHAHRKIVNIQPLVGAGHAWYKNTVMYDDASRGHTASYVWPDGTTGAKAMDGYQGAFSIRAGLNVEFNLNRTLALGIRAQYNYFVNDYIDNRGFSGMNSLASKNNDGIADVTLNMRFKLEAVKKTHVRNVVHELEAAKKNDESKYIHDTVIIRHDSIIVRETIREVTKEKEQQRVYYVYFQNNKSVLDEKALITIQQVADIMAEDTSVYAVVTGFCDNTGSAHLNYVLGDKRADAVIGELREEHAVGADHLYAMGMGKLVGHRSVAAYGPNRRAAIRLVDKATFDRMKSDLNDKRAQRDDPEEKEEVVPAQEEKTIPLSESARPEKVNIYKQRAAEEVTTDKTTTLSRLARQYYNNTYCWVYIYIANKEKINNPNALEPGTKLIIPELTQHEMEITKDESLVVYSNARSGK
jgi:outer membrane protein OmpA-like peptidoglycan-associated protein